MAFNKRQGKRVMDYVKYEQASGVRMDPGPHIGIVQHVVDSTRTGRLIVFLPHLGGDPNNIDNCRIVSYASPFYGETNLQVDAANNPNIGNKFETVRHSYGMWFTPPDVGIKVLVIFETGDTNNGYWFACIPGTGEHTTTGSMGGSTAAQVEYDPEVSELISGNSAKYVPTVDFNAADHTKMRTPGWQSTKRPPHKTQTAILSEQGLLGDEHRGINNSSTNRESPSCVFGITTPGRPYKDQTTDRILKRTSVFPPTQAPPAAEKVNTGRKGGHSFIMDDGDVFGESRMLRMRSAAGHQIMMHDTEGFMYISNSTGTNWIELTNDGNMYVYSKNDIALRCGRDMTFKVDRDFKIEVDRNFHLKVREHMQVENKTQVDITEEDRFSIIQKNFRIRTTGATEMQSQSVSILAYDNFIVKSGDNITMKTGQIAVTATGKISLQATDAAIVNGSTVELNSASGLTPFDVPSILMPELLVKKDLLDSIPYGNTVWRSETTTEHTAQTTLDIITTHEPFAGRKTHTIPIVGGGPASGPPKINV